MSYKVADQAPVRTEYDHMGCRMRVTIGVSALEMLQNSKPEQVDALVEARTTAARQDISSAIKEWQKAHGVK